MSAEKIILCGQAPGPTGPPPGRPLVGGRSGEFLRSLTGLQLRRYLWCFDTVNVLPYYPGKDGKKGDRFPMMEAKTFASELSKKWAGRRVVFVGLAVAEAFGAISPRPFQWRIYRDDRMLVSEGFYGAAIPHVSGIVAFWNDEANVLAAREFFRSALSMTVRGRSALARTQREMA